MLTVEPRTVAPLIFAVPVAQRAFEPSVQPLSASDVPVATPRIGVTSVGVVAKTADPVPVSSVSAPRRFALDGVARKVATPVPRPLTLLPIRNASR